MVRRWENADKSQWFEFKQIDQSQFEYASSNTGTEWRNSIANSWSYVENAIPDGFTEVNNRPENVIRRWQKGDHWADYRKNNTGIFEARGKIDTIWHETKMITDWEQIESYWKGHGYLEVPYPQKGNFKNPTEAISCVTTGHEPMQYIGFKETKTICRKCDKDL